MPTPTPRALRPDDLISIKAVADAQLSPDGGAVAYTRTEMAVEEDGYRSTIWTVPVGGGDPVQLTRGPKRDSAPRWSPDGTWLAFLSDRDGARAEMYLMPARGGEPRKLSAPGDVSSPAVWSPDGTRIVLAARVPNEPPPADPAAQARWAERPKVVTKAHYKSDGQGYIGGATSSLFVLSVHGGTPTQVTRGEGDAVAPAWSPDGSRIAFSRARGGVADFNVCDIWVMDADGGDARRVTENVGRATSPSWSPDGAWIVCYGTDMQEPGMGDPMVRVWLVPTTGGPPRRLTEGDDRQVVLVARPAVTPGAVWAPDGDSVTFLAADSGNIHIVRARVGGGSVRTVVGGERQVMSASAVPGPGRIAFVATDPQLPSDVYACRWDGSEERRLTATNDAVLSQLALPRVERRTIASPHGGVVEGWLIRSKAGSAPAPLLLDIHGGPASFHGNQFPLGYFYRYVLASRGWAVLALNPVGSGSYGKAFAHAARGRWGERDLPEQLAGVDALVSEGIADPDRLAVAGYSYGGFMAAWTITHTHRFKAGVVGAPVTNLESFHGTSDIGMWFTPWEMDGELIAHRERYRRLSPINYVDRVRTPTLILHGEADDRCPIGQGEEFFIGLISEGRVPAEFVRYPGESHLFLGNGRPSHRIDFTRRVVEWVERYVIGAGRA
ncbi:MAG TPA: S9 family peptidase [bacterium]|nr:S9 family peptidase [bacterium]